MKTKFTIFLILNTLFLVAIAYLLLYEAEHGAKKIVIAALTAGMACFIILFFLFYLKSFKTSSKNGNLRNGE